MHKELSMYTRSILILLNYLLYSYFILLSCANDRILHMGLILCKPTDAVESWCTWLVFTAYSCHVGRLIELSSMVSSAQIAIITGHHLGAAHVLSCALREFHSSLTIVKVRGRSIAVT